MMWVLGISMGLIVAIFAVMAAGVQARACRLPAARPPSTSAR